MADNNKYSSIQLTTKIRQELLELKTGIITGHNTDMSYDEALQYLLKIIRVFNKAFGTIESQKVVDKLGEIFQQELTPHQLTFFERIITEKKESEKNG